MAELDSASYAAQVAQNSWEALAIIEVLDEEQLGSREQ